MVADELGKKGVFNLGHLTFAGENSTAAAGVTLSGAEAGSLEGQAALGEDQREEQGLKTPLPLPRSEVLSPVASSGSRDEARLKVHLAPL